MANSPETLAAGRRETKQVIPVDEHIIEIVSDSGEGAQKAGQSFGAISAKMGNGVWTVEIIPAEINLPPRTVQGASGIRIRIGSRKITNPGNEADLVIAFNEKVPYARIEQMAYKEGTVLLIESKWGEDESEEIRNSYVEAIQDFRERGYVVHEIPMEKECLRWVRNPKKGKNMWVLGLLCYLYDRSLERAEEQIRQIFRKKSDAIVESNLQLLQAGYEWALQQLDFRFDLPSIPSESEMVVMNGNEALSLGIMASGIEVFHVPHHARHFGHPPPGRSFRTGRRTRTPGRR